MKLLFYSKAFNKNVEQLKESLKTLVPHHKLKIYQTVEHLSDRLSQPQNEKTIMVLFAKDRDDLMSIISLHKLLQNYRNIIILPDRNKETIQLGHRLCPRFLAFADDDFKITNGVLRKMINAQTSL